MGLNHQSGCDSLLYWPSWLPGDTHLLDVMSQAREELSAVPGSLHLMEVRGPSSRRVSQSGLAQTATVKDKASQVAVSCQRTHGLTGTKAQLCHPVLTAQCCVPQMPETSLPSLSRDAHKTCSSPSTSSPNQITGGPAWSRGLGRTWSHHVQLSVLP